MIYCFDIDGTLCTKTDGVYEQAEPFFERIAFVNELYETGHIIKLFTARGSTTGKSWRHLTEQQLNDWKVRYHELIMGKPEADIFIDDKAFNADRWHWIIPRSQSVLKYQQYQQIHKTLEEALLIHELLLADPVLQSQLSTLVDLCLKTLRTGGKIVFAGNGGSFADAQHLAAEFTSRLRFDRPPLAAIALGTNSSSMSAIANDYGYDQVFARELKAIAASKDIFIPISTSGNSPNILAAAEVARELSLPTVGFTGEHGGTLATLCPCLHVPSKRTERVQEGHIVLGHILCETVESIYFQQSVLDVVRESA